MLLKLALYTGQIAAQGSHGNGRLPPDSSTRKAMLPRELVEVFLRGFRAARRHVLDTLPNRLGGLLVVLTLPFQVFGQRFVKSIGRRLSASTRKLLELGEPLGFDRQRHASKVELRQ